MPPSPLVRTIRPRSVPSNRLAASAPKVSYVPCRIPWLPMYIQLPAVICPYMIRPSRSSSQKCSQVAQRGTSKLFAISTRGAYSWVRKMPTGFPDWTSSVSSSCSRRSAATIAWKEGQSRAALPVPP